MQTRAAAGKSPSTWTLSSREHRLPAPPSFLLSFATCMSVHAWDCSRDREVPITGSPTNSCIRTISNCHVLAAFGTHGPSCRQHQQTMDSRRCQRREKQSQSSWGWDDCHYRSGSVCHTNAAVTHTSPVWLGYTCYNLVNNHSSAVTVQAAPLHGRRGRGNRRGRRRGWQRQQQRL
jgi:hypothetical protein